MNTTAETLAALPPTLAAFVRAYLVTALWSSRDAAYFHRKAAEAAGWGVHCETVDGAEKWVHVAPGENGADFVHEREHESEAWEDAAEAVGLVTDGNLDADFSAEDFTPEAAARAIADCSRFISENAATLNAAIESGEVVCGPDFDEWGRAGHDFWLTRNGHGAGFWDGDWPEDAGKTLSDSARAFRELDPYVTPEGGVAFD